MEGHVVRLAVTIHFDVQSGAQGIDHGGAHAVQATDGVIRRVAELGTGMQFGQYDLHAGQAGFRFLIHRNASAIVRDFHGTVGVQGDHNVVAEAGQGSSTELSMISHRQCIRPCESVVPMYMPGRLRTASKPSRTARSLAPYSSLGIQSYFSLQMLGSPHRGEPDDH